MTCTSGREGAGDAGYRGARLGDPFAARALAVRLGSRVVTQSEAVRLADAVGRIVAADVHSPVTLPRFTASAMDGYAVRSEDTRHATTARPVRLDLVGEARAGHAQHRQVRRNDAHRISTGARLPPGADAVVRLEEATERGAVVEVRRCVQRLRDIRVVGEDVAEDDLVLRAGDALHPGSVALLAGLGHARVRVRARPTATVLVTGDELRGPGEAPTEDAINDVNGVSIPALLTAAGAVVQEVVRVGDDHDATVRALHDATGDLVVTCGGISVGRHDHLRGALHEAGAVERASGVAMRPGGPTWFGSLERRGDPETPRPVLGLPGNPAAALVTAILFAVPAIQALGGRASGAPRSARLAVRAPVDPRRHTVLWSRLGTGPDGLPTLTPAAEQGSHRLRPLPACDALAIVPHGPAPLPSGARVWFVPVPGSSAA